MAQVIDVVADGNCFFRALYNAARDHGKLGEIAVCFSLDDANEMNCLSLIRDVPTSAPVTVNGAVEPGLTHNKQEDAFVNCLRNALAHQVQQQSLSNSPIAGFYNLVRGLMRSDAPEDGLRAAGFSHDLRAAIMSCASVKEFRDSMAGHIATAGRWVHEFEVQLVRGVLSECLGQDILRIVPTQMSPMLLTEDQIRSRTGELVLVCWGESHYQYVRQADAAPAAGGGGGKAKKQKKAAKAAAGGRAANPFKKATVVATSKPATTAKANKGRK